MDRESGMRLDWRTVCRGSYIGKMVSVALGMMLATALTAAPPETPAAVPKPAAGTAKDHDAVSKSAAVTAKDKDAAGNAVYRDMALFVSVMRILNRDYVDAEKATYPNLIRGALSGMLASLDKYSGYMPKKEFTGLVENTGGKYVGIGVVYHFNGKTLRVEKVLPDSPAAVAGIQPADELVTINGREVAKMTMKECMNLLRGEVGSRVRLGYLRPPSKTPMELEVRRGEVITSPVPDNGVQVLPGHIGYIRIDTFSAPLIKAVDEALKRLTGHKINGLVLDLRDNPGGLLDGAVQLCSRFIPKGKNVVSTVGRTPRDCVTYRAVECDKYLGLPLVVLVNHGSASAAEITAGCLKDHRRALLIGENTYGKASVQRIQMLPDNYGGIRYTVAWYHTPNDIRIQGKGITPDIKVEFPAASRSLFRAQLRRHPGVVLPSDKGAVTDVQLQRAVEIVQGAQLFRQNGR